MNPRLETLYQSISSSSQLAGEEKETLLQMLKAVDKELEILAFKLERTEKVKRTTAILLEETIEELEQKRKAIEETLAELKVTQDQLVRQEKLASLGQLTAGIAHEIKNPLNFVNNFSDVSIELIEEAVDELNHLAENEHLTEAKELLSDVMSNLRKIHEHGTRADGIVKSMLLHSRGKSGEKTPVDLNKLLDEYLKLAYHGMRAADKSFNLNMITDYDPEIGTLKAVAQDLSRAFLNLINNAMYAAKDISAQHPSREPTLWISTQRKERKAIIKIRDNGAGIPEEFREKIFEPFFTTKPTGEGTGLGLSMTHDIVTLHQGKLELNTVSGQYTEFTITLPLD